MSEWKLLHSHYLWQSKWYSLRQDRLRTREGHEFTYTIVEHPGAVWVVPVTPDGQIVLIRSYRYTVDEWCYEVPAGGLPPELDPAQRLAESEKVALRELHEEVGGIAASIRFVGKCYSSNGISNETVYVYLATGVTLGDRDQEPTELIEVHQVPIKTALDMARTGEISDGPSALALLWCEPLLHEL